MVPYHKKDRKTGDEIKTVLLTISKLRNQVYEGAVSDGN